MDCSLERVERFYAAMLAYINRRYPQWQIGRERYMWTATQRPTPTSIWFIYAKSLNQLERKLSEERSPD